MTRKTKNRDLMNKFLFENFLEQLGDFELKVDHGVNRWVLLDQDDKEWCNGIDILNTFTLLPRVTSVLFSYKNNNYLVITGFNNINKFDPALLLEEIEISTGIFLTIVNESHVPIKKDVEKYEIYNYVLSQHEAPDYNGHSLIDLIDFFESINIYRIDDNSLFYNNSLEKITAYVLYNNPHELYLEFSNQTMNQLHNLLFKVQNELPYHHICKCLLSVQWKDAFLEIYKCIESIFHFEALTEMFAKSQSSLTIYDFSALLDTEIGWRPKEQDTLKRIFGKINNIPKELINELKSAEEKDINDHKWVYKIRNSIVHSRPSTEDVTFTNKQWDSLIQATLHILEQWHKLNKI